MDVMYASRDRILRSLEVLNSAYAGQKIDETIKASSRSVEGFLHRRFYPELRTIYRDWPNNYLAPAWEMPLWDQELISLTTVESGGVNITANCILRRGDDLAEPPYSTLVVDLSSNASFSAGTTFQRSMQITGLFGYNDTDTTLAGAALSGGINSSVTAITLVPSSGLLTAETGSLLKIDSERMIVLRRNMATTGATTSSSMLASAGATTFTTASASSLVIGETILIDGERMRVNDIAGSTIIVTRAWDGTPLTAHSSGVTIYGLRSLTVRRGVLGSTAASHLDAAAVYVHEFPSLVAELTAAETIVSLQQNAAAYARTIGSGAGTREAAGLGLDDLRERAWRAYGRKTRSAAV